MLDGPTELSTPDPLVGRTVAERYTIVRPVARGAMGRVYEAEQRPLGQRVALKVLDIRASDVQTNDYLERFRREADSMASLRSPATVRILDYGWWEGVTWLAMEFVDGITLSALVTAEGALEARRALSLGLQIADSLREAHAHDLVHRDLKPANVLVERIAGGDERVKVIDWGLVKGLDDGDQTDTGLMLGTPSWMAPEQIRGETVDGRADQYAFGCLMYYVLTGKKPFEGKGTVGLLYKHLETEATAIRKLRPSVPPGLAEVITRCMRKSPEERYGSTDELVQALRRVADVLGAQAVLSTLVTPAPALPRTRRNAGCVGATATVMSLGLVGLFLAVGLLAVAWTWSRPTTTHGYLLKPDTWTGEVTLDGPVFVVGTTLTLEPGTTVRAAPGSALVIARGSRLVARGTTEAPIVFTSAEPIPRPGDWGGVVLLGSALVQGGEAVVEGWEHDAQLGLYGGDASDSSCGVLEHVDIAYAGFELSANNELNGLTLAGCGSGTIVRDLAVRDTLDDGVELFGGSVDLERVTVFRPGDDGIDIDLGWSGRGQQLAVELAADRGDNAIEVDGAGLSGMPVLSNVTLLGVRGGRAAHRGLLLQAGAELRIQNLVAGRFERGLLDVRGTPGLIDLRSTYAFDVGRDGTTPFPAETGEQDDDGGYDEAAKLGKVVTTGPDVLDPVGVPLKDLGVSPTPVPDEEFWDAANGRFLGAIGAKGSWRPAWAQPTE